MYSVYTGFNCCSVVWCQNLHRILNGTQQGLSERSCWQDKWCPIKTSKKRSWNVRGFQFYHAIHILVEWLAPRAGNVNQILCCDWLPKRAINPLLAKLVLSRWLDWPSSLALYFWHGYRPQLHQSINTVHLVHTTKLYKILGTAGWCISHYLSKSTTDMWKLLLLGAGGKATKIDRGRGGMGVTPDGLASRVSVAMETGISSGLSARE